MALFRASARMFARLEPPSRSRPAPLDGFDMIEPSMNGLVSLSTASSKTWLEFIEFPSAIPICFPSFLLLWYPWNFGSSFEIDRLEDYGRGAILRWPLWVLNSGVYASLKLRPNYFSCLFYIGTRSSQSNELTSVAQSFAFTSMPTRLGPPGFTIFWMGCVLINLSSYRPCVAKATVLVFALVLYLVSKLLNFYDRFSLGARLLTLQPVCDGISLRFDLLNGLTASGL